MTDNTQAKRTYKELDELLMILQFRGAKSEDRSKTYWHERSDTLILLPASRPTQPICSGSPGSRGWNIVACSGSLTPPRP